METIKFLKDRICLNVLSHDVENAKAIYEATEGHVLVGMLSKNYASVEEAVQAMKSIADEINHAVSVGLGAGDPNQWKMVSEIAKDLQSPHVNQVFTAVPYTRALIDNENILVNALVGPSGKPGYVNLATGPLSSKTEGTEVAVHTAIKILKDMGANSLKYFPMKGLTHLEEYRAVCQACAEENFILEPTGGIDLDNFEEIISIALDEGVPKVIPHVYSSIIDSDTGLTRIGDVETLYSIMKKVLA